MSAIEVISYCNGNIEKCKMCVLTKMTTSSFPKVERIIKILELIHSDLGNFHNTPLGGKKYYVTFVDEFS